MMKKCMALLLAAALMMGTLGAAAEAAAPADEPVLACSAE